MVFKNLRGQSPVARLSQMRFVEHLCRQRLATYQKTQRVARSLCDLSLSFLFMLDEVHCSRSSCERLRSPWTRRDQRCICTVQDSGGNGSCQRLELMAARRTACGAQLWRRPVLADSQSAATDIIITARNRLSLPLLHSQSAL